MELVIILSLLLIGLIVGTVGSLVGIGGGAIMVPFLTMLFNIPIKRAVAISMVNVLATSLSGSTYYIRQKITDVKLGIMMGIPVTLGATVGAMVASVTPSSIIELMFGSIAGYISYRLVSSSLRWRGRNPKVSVKVFRYEARSLTFGALGSFVIGVFSAMTGIGGGAYLTSLMSLYMGVPVKSAIATSVFIVGLTGSSSSIVYYISGILDLMLAIPPTVGTLIGAQIGARLLSRAKPRVLRMGLALLLIYVSFRMLFSFFQSFIS